MRGDELVMGDLGKRKKKDVAKHDGDYRSLLTRFGILGGMRVS